MFVRYLIADKIETHKLVWKHESRYFPFAGVVCCEITIYIVNRFIESQDVYSCARHTK